MSLGREHIERHRPVPPPARIGLGDAVAALFGAVIPEPDDPDGQTEVAPAYRPNRAARRAAAKQARRRG